jgi:hypothetical protein
MLIEFGIFEALSVAEGRDDIISHFHRSVLALPPLVKLVGQVFLWDGFRQSRPLKDVVSYLIQALLFLLVVLLQELLPLVFLLWSPF